MCTRLKIQILEWLMSIEDEVEFGIFLINIGKVVRNLAPKRDRESQELLTFVIRLKELCYRNPLSLDRLRPYCKISFAITRAEIDLLLGEFPGYDETPDVFDGVSSLAARRIGSSSAALDIKERIVRRISGTLKREFGRTPGDVVTHPVFLHYRGDLGRQDALPYHFDSRGRVMFSVILPILKTRSDSSVVVRTSSGEYVRAPAPEIGEAVVIPAGCLPHAREPLAEEEELIVMVCGIPDPLWSDFIPVSSRHDLGRQMAALL